MQIIITTSKKAFTLIELLVASAIFSMVIMLASGALIQSQDLAKSLRFNQFAYDGLQMATDYINRDIRYGTAFHCGSLTDGDYTLRKNCSFSASDGNNSIVFKSFDMLGVADRVEYSLANGRIWRKTIIGGLQEDTELTGREVKVNDLRFFVDGAASAVDGSLNSVSSDNIQPVITIYAQGQTEPNHKGVVPIPFHYQTTVSVRGIEN